MENYLYSFYFRGDTALPTLDKSYSNLHNRALLLLSDLKEDGHVVNWDNLYPNAQIAAALLDGKEVTLTDKRKPTAKQVTTYTIPKTRTMGTCRKGRGFDDSGVWQEEPTGKKNIADMKEKDIAKKLFMAVDENTGLLVITVYDSKWVKFVSTAHTEITVNELVRQIWDAEAKSKMPKVVFRLNVNDDYNNNMNSVDRVDQLFKNYYLKGNFRVNKWWFTIWLWRLKKSVDNQWSLYMRQCEIENEENTKAYEVKRKARAAQTGTTLTALPPLVKVKPLTHAVFMEKVAEGLFVLGHNYRLTEEQQATDVGSALLEQTKKNKEPWVAASATRLTADSMPIERLICPREIGSWDEIEKEGERKEHACKYPLCPKKLASQASSSTNGTNKRKNAVKEGGKSRSKAPRTRCLCLSCGYSLCWDTCFSEYHGIKKRKLK